MLEVPWLLKIQTKYQNKNLDVYFIHHEKLKKLNDLFYCYKTGLLNLYN